MDSFSVSLHAQPKTSLMDISIENEISLQRSKLYHYALKFTNNHDDVNDLVHDTILKAMRFRASYQPDTNLIAWLYTIMRNTFINDFRRKNRRNLLINTTESLTYVQLKSSATQNLAEKSLVMEDIHKAFEKLPAVYAVPFLRYFEGYKYYEIAEELDIPVGTVKTRIHMARKYLKKKLVMYGEAAG